MTEPLPPIREDLFTVTPGGIRLVAASCTTCRELHFPRTETCPYCGEPSVPRHIGPTGTLRLCTVVRRAPPGYAGPVPYGFGVVEVGHTRLEVVSRIVASDLDALAPGAAVRLVIDTLAIDDDGGRALTWAFEVC